MGKRPHPYTMRLQREALPQWAIDLLSARHLRRTVEVYRHVEPSGRCLALFEAVIKELESGHPTQASLTKIGLDLEDMRAEFQVPEIRQPIRIFEDVCGSRARKRADFIGGAWSDSPLPKEVRKADQRLMERTEQHDLDVLTKVATKKRPENAISLLGPLWPKGEPQWLHATWSTQEQMERRLARMWGEDAPPDEPRPAELPLSQNLPEGLIELLAPGPFDLVYKAVYEVKAPQASPGGRTTLFYKPRDHKLRFPTPGQHAFREPSQTEILEQFRRKADSRAGSLRLLWAFYREHDGALLFQPIKGGPTDAHIHIYGLSDQEQAVRSVTYYMEGDEIDSDVPVDKFFNVMNCTTDTVLCLARIDASFFLIPLRGESAGKVFRFSARANRLSVFAPTAEEALALFVKKTGQLSGQTGPVHKIGDESYGQASQMKLTGVKPRTKAPSKQ